MTRNAAAVALIGLLWGAVPARAQEPTPVPDVTVTGGWAGFADEGLIHHGVIGGGAQWVPTRHLAVGPDVLYAIGPGSDRDLFVLGVVRVGVLPYARPVVPFVTAGAGLMRHSARFSSGAASSTEGAFVAGGGVRWRVSPRVHVAPEFTVGWELHMRVSVTAGFTLR